MKYHYYFVNEVTGCFIKSYKKYENPLDAIMGQSEAWEYESVQAFVDIYHDYDVYCKTTKDDKSVLTEVGDVFGITYEYLNPKEVS